MTVEVVNDAPMGNAIQNFEEGEDVVSSDVVVKEEMDLD